MSKVFVVLGMHRSATSLVSKALLNEIYMGPTPGGNVFESRPFGVLNRAILRRAGGSWHDPPPEQAILNQYDHFRERIIETIESDRGARELWGWKDPRTTLTIRLYLPHLENPHFISIFRNPLEVAKSLQRRDGFPIERGIRIANIYNTRLINFLSCSELDYCGPVKAEVERAEYQRGYHAATHGMHHQTNESAEWHRGYHDGQMDLSLAGKTRADD